MNVIAQGDIVSKVNLVDANILLINGQFDFLVRTGKYYNSNYHQNILKKILIILNDPQFRKSPEHYVARFMNTTSHLEKDSLLKNVSLILKDILDKQSLQFTDKIIYLKDLDHSKLIMDENTKYCLLDMLNNRNLDRYKNETKTLAKEKLCQWKSINDNIYI